MAGTRGLVTTLDDRTGSVGESSAPSRNDSGPVRSVSTCAPTATITAVSGIASTSLRSGRRQCCWSISPSTSRPSRNKITIRATMARLADERRPRVEVDGVGAAGAENEADQRRTARSATGSFGRATPDTSAPMHEQTPSASSDASKRVLSAASSNGICTWATATRLECQSLERGAVCEITVLGKSPSWQDVGGACSGYLVQRGRLRAAARLRQRRVLQAARARRLRRRRRGADQPPARRPLPRPRPVQLRADLRAASAARAGRRGGPGPSTRRARSCTRRSARQEFFRQRRRLLGQRGADRATRSPCTSTTAEDELTLGPFAVRFCEVPHYTLTYAVELTTAPAAGG